ncbi:MAG: shikimate kinase [Albidovulum sp.]|nr:shikimate kinase [Albidovulum sp.]MDE0530987.1 shikimate kinase [Albidovulum sp.]
MENITQNKLKRSVVLVGMMGCGKSAVGAELAKLLSVPFLDSDGEIKKSEQMEIAQIFERFGEQYFRELESRTLDKLLHGGSKVIGGGGGMFMLERNRHMICEQGVSLWLKAEPDLLWERVRHKSTRPLLRTDDPYKTLRELLEERTPFYGKAQIAVEAEWGLTVPEMAAKVVRALADSELGIVAKLDENGT